MSELIHLHYDVDGEDFVSCGRASEDVRRTLKNIGIASDVIRKVSIAMYEGEINMVIHAAFLYPSSYSTPLFALLDPCAVIALLHIVSKRM